VSYSWTSPAHETWVLNLAKELVELGVDVILDKWTLREGADKYASMEKMVTDPSVRKGILICDQLYAEKADAERGSVGNETQIVSPEFYNQIDPVDQRQKFVVVVTENDHNGKPCLPTFLKGRIYALSCRKVIFTGSSNKISMRALHNKHRLVVSPWPFAFNILGTTSAIDTMGAFNPSNKFIPL
jgi:hypothetical protein